LLKTSYLLTLAGNCSKHLLLFGQLQCQWGTPDASLAPVTHHALLSQQDLLMSCVRDDCNRAAHCCWNFTHQRVTSASMLFVLDDNKRSEHEAL
jgi:hypothetical protein